MLQFCFYVSLIIPILYLPKTQPLLNLKRNMPVSARLVFLLLLLTLPLAAQESLKKVTLQLSWFDQFQFAGYYMAKEKGFYKAAGLEVEILPFSFEANIPAMVDEGKVDFAIGREALIIERANGKRIVALYALFQFSPLVLIATQEANINSVENFKQKRIMIAADDAEEVSLQAILNSHHLQQKDYIHLAHTHDINSLIQGKTDLISAYTSKAPFHLEQKGIPYRVFHPKDYGFDTYSDFLYTSETLVEKDISTVAAFREASLKGWEYAFSNIEQTAAFIFAHHNPQNLALEELIFEGKTLKKHAYHQTQTLGLIDKNKLQRIYDLYNIMGYIPHKMSVHDFVLHNFGTLTREEKEYLKHKRRITVCADPGWPPYERIQNGELVGVSAQYLRLIEPILGLPFVLVPTHSWEMSLAYAKERHCDIITLAAQTPSRQAYLNFTSPYFSTPLVIATANHAEFIAELADVKDRPIGVVADYASVEILKSIYPDIHLVKVENIAQGLHLVSKGELFGFVDSLVSINYILQQEYVGVLKISGKIDKNYELGFGVRKDEPLLQQVLEKTIGAIDETTKQSIRAQWTNIQYEKKFDYSLFWKVLFVLGVVFALLSLRYRTIRSYNQQISKHLRIIDKYVLLYRTDAHGKITYVSQALCETCGYAKEELLGKPLEYFNQPSSCQETLSSMKTALQSGHSWHGEFENLHKNGTTYWVETQISPTFDKYGNIEGYNAFAYNITDKKRIQALSNTDSLTQIPNRLFLDAFYAKKLSCVKRYEEIFSIIIIDLDYFKAINDTFGHTCGDRVLVEMATLLKRSIRESDVLGRWGGEEFVIICPNATKDDAVVLAEKIQTLVRNTTFEKGVVRLTCSIGIAHFEPNDKETDTFNRADQALYEAKNNGRDRIVVH